MPTTNEWTRVVVLSPPSASAGRAAGLSDGLKSLFAARDWFAIEQHDPYMAMAELCLRERAQVARAAWGLQRMEQTALVILEPGRWPNLDELVRAMREYLPSATIWTASDSDITPLDDSVHAASRASALTNASKSRARAAAPSMTPSAPVDPAARRPSSAPVLRMTAAAQLNPVLDPGSSAAKIGEPGQPGPHGPLRIAAASPSAPSAQRADSANGTRADSPALVGLDDHDDADAAAAAQRISREEIQMLLQDEDREAGP